MCALLWADRARGTTEAQRQPIDVESGAGLASASEHSAAEDEAHRFSTCRRAVTEAATDRARDGLRARFPHAAVGHAQVLTLDDDDDATWVQRCFERVGDLRRQPLLHLR